MLGAPSSPQIVPRTEGTTLTGAPVVFPKGGSEKPLVLVFGFSHESSGDVTSWNKRFEVAYENDRIDYYELADLQGVPSFVIKMILHGMRRSIQEPERSHFIPFFKQEAYWKELVDYNDPKIGYVVLADGSGHVIRRTRGPASDAKAAELEAAITKLRATKK